MQHGVHADMCTCMRSRVFIFPFLLTGLFFPCSSSLFFFASVNVTTGTFIEVDVDILEDVAADVGVNAM